jgi:hypothetical protein
MKSSCHHTLQGFASTVPQVDYSLLLQANKAQLSATVATQVEAARAGMALLDKAHRTLANMQNSYKVSLLPCKHSFPSETRLFTITRHYGLQQLLCKD